MADTVYLKFEKNVEVHSREVNLGLAGQIYCANPSVQAKCRALKLANIHENENHRQVFSVLQVTQIIQEMDSQLTVSNLGETDFIVDYQPAGSRKRAWAWTKTLAVCVIVFVGAAFAIMTFNNDGDVPKIFTDLYMQVMGREPGQVNVLNISYSIGLPLGIIVFYNHFSKVAFSSDPTPLEVQMRTYEDDVDTTLIKNAGRKESGVDVS